MKGPGQRAGAHVKARTVARALDGMAVKAALIERAAVVGADVGDGVELPVDVAQGDLFVGQIYDLHRAGRNVRCLGCSD